MAISRNKLVFSCLASLLLSTSCVRQQVPVTASTAPVRAVSANTSPAPVAERTYLEGKWSYTMTNPDQAPFSGILSVQRGGTAGYSGWISVSTIDYEAQTAITKAEVQGEKFIYAGEVKTLQGSFPFEFTGTIKGDKMEGQNKVQTQEGQVVFKVTATRR